ncbi:Hint domain-containing protein [Acidisoma silvae]|uniref:Hint domain-containing protein n=1 Tax=Acidisoma silvae TaxID=2802396 RepID=A0A963YPC5_9PROT|nr:Hint domain-containing protein [Acidisoma silvae]MCB8874534.1 Hint domain-containing protein [Acidisoma silvae]
MTIITISSGTTAVTPATIRAGDVLVVDSGGTALSALISGGSEQLFGVDLDATVTGGGFQAISSGGIASGTVVSSGGFELVSAGGTAISTTVLAGLLIAQSGSTVSALSVASGGYAIIEPGGAATVTAGSAISTGAVVIDADGSVGSLAVGQTVASGAQVLVLTDGVASGGTLLPGASEEIFTGGQAQDVTVDSSIQVVNAGAVAIGSVLENGGVQYVFSSGTAISTTVLNGYSIVDSAGIARDTKVGSGGIQAVYGVVSNTEVENGGALYIVNVGTAYVGSAFDTVIDAGGAAYVYGTIRGGSVSGFAILSGATAEDVTIAAGGEIIAFGGTESDLIIESGAVLVADGGTIIDPTIEAGGTVIALPGTLLVTSTTDGIGAGQLITGGHVVINGGTSAFLYTASAGLTLQSGATGFVYGGGTESGTVIGLNAVDRVASGGVAYDDIIGAGGALIIAAGGAASGSITFSGTDGTLTLYDGLSASTVVNGFAAGDTIDIETIQPSGTGTLSATIDPSGLLTVTSVTSSTNGSSSSTSTAINLGSAYAGDTFSATASPAGGIAVTLVQATSGTVTPTTQAPVDIPIYVLPYNDSYKLGIEVSFDGGQTYKMVELDTGASGFFAAYTPDWWSSYTAVGTAPDAMTYVSGNDYVAQVVNTAVTLQTTGGTPLTVSNVNVGLITNAADQGNFSTQNWNTSLTSDPTTAPLEDYFYGDFGLGLNDNNGIEAVLGQLGNGLSNGFVITIGNNPDGALGQVGTLQVGLTEADIESYDTIIALNGRNLADTFANSGYATYGKSQATGTISVNGTSVPTSFIFDTGATHTTIFTGTTLTVDGSLETATKTGERLSDGINVVLSSTGVGSDIGWTLSIQGAGTIAGVNEVGVATAADATNPGAVNTGIGAYYGESIMFDLADGIMGIKAIACFAEGTRIRTPAGDRAVETMAAGDSVTVVGGRQETVRWIGHRSLDCSRHPDPASVLPVRILAHAFGPQQPARDLLLSPDHALFMEGVLIPVKYLINGDSVAQLNQPRVTYYHIELATHDVIFAEGLPTETYLETGQRAAFVNGGGVIEAHPRFSPPELDAQLRWAALGYAPLVIAGPQVERLRARLAANQGAGHATAAPSGRRERGLGSP